VNAHASTVILTLPNGVNQSYNIPSHAKITIGGQPKTVFDLRKGMKIEATIVTDDAHTVVEQSKSVVAELPAPPVTPAMFGTLLIYRPAPAQPAALVASTEQPASTLPATGTSLPFLGLLGALALTASLGLGAIRQSRKA
jgi:LPXTG-motif cell wall-anchored protein